MTSPKESLELANIAFYALAVLPAIYCFIKHGKHGIVGWLYVMLMCGLRLAGNGMSYHAPFPIDKPNVAASIIVGIGLSPLLFAALGLLQESNTSIQSSLTPFLGRAAMLIPHLIIGAGIGMAAASGKNLNLLKAGMIIVAMGWFIITGMIALSFRASAHCDRLSGEKKLLLALIIAAPILGMRVVYAIVTVFKYGYSSQASLPVQVIFGTLPEFLVMSTYLYAGIVTRNLPRDRSEKDNTAHASISDPSYNTTLHSVTPPAHNTGYTIV
ncbi:hypothetical protein N7523_003822 [Penicillium sp. IBT 18751x]|nr:hypothetical protein N7523_003822 [Penicillium sp. IBT 18751x]